MPAATSAPVPALATTAPTMPPISACDELDGMPYHQVIDVPGDRADQRAEHHVVVDDARVDDALADRGGDAQVEDEDRDEVEEGGEDAPPGCGLSTPVETTVAIEFAASWKPFMKSNASASTTSSTTTQKPIWIDCHRPRYQEFSRTMPSITLATSSQRSVIDLEQLVDRLAA